MTPVHLTAIFKLKPKQIQVAAFPAVKRWLAACSKILKQRTEAPPRRPTNFRRANTTGCTCADCQALASFLDDPSLETVRLPLAKDRRQHLHRIIDGKRLDCTHVTERIGRPHILVCKKTMGAYQAAEKIYQRDLGNLAQLQTLMTR